MELPSAFEALKAGARKAADGKKTLNLSKNKKRKRKTEEPFPPTNPTLFSVEKPSNSVEVQKTEFKNTKVEAVVNVDEFVSNLTKDESRFEPNSAAWWEDGDKVPFLFLAKAFDLIKAESGRNVITQITCNLLRTVIAKTPDDLLEVVYLLANKIAPAHQGLKLGIGDDSLIKALAEASGTPQQAVEISFKEMGDLGDVAQAIRSKQTLILQHPPLTVSKVFNTFRRIAKESRNKRKLDFIKSLIVAAKDCEPVYLIRLLQAKLRISLAEQTLLIALGQAAVYSEEHSKPPSNVQSPMQEAGKIVKQVYSAVPVYDKIIPSLLSDGVWLLPKTCNITPGVPIELMSAKPTTSVSEIMDKFQDMTFTCEYKYDGERAQIHYLEDGSVEIYTRAALRNTEKFPDVVAALHRFKKSSANSFILDCEIVGYDREKQTICSFQHLYDSFEEVPGYFQFVKTLTSNDLGEINKFLEAAFNASCEGLVIKSLEKEATYEPSKESNNWLKLKKDYMDNFGDSLDLVPIAAFGGRGNRKGVYGSFVLACYDRQKEEFQSICKVGTGFSEEVLKKCSSILQSKVISVPKPYFRYGNTLKPDVWFEPSEVWEVKAAGLTVSEAYRAAVGEVHPIKGISLRFPRFVRLRLDKSLEDATSSVQVAEMYKSQAHNPHCKKDDLEESSDND